MTPTAQATAGAMIMRYAPGAAEGEGSKVIYEQMDADDNGLVPLEKAIWLKLLGTMGRKNATNDNASAKIESVGVMAGMDLFSNDYLRVGVLGSITDVSVEVNENDNKLDAIALKGGVTATAEIGKWYLDGLGTFSQERTKTSRTVDIDGLGDLRPMWSKYTNRRINAAFETGFRFTAGRVVIQPLAGVSANWLKQQRVLEQGNADAAVLTDKNTTMTGTTKLGMNLSTVIIGDHITVVPTIGGYWGHRFGELSNASRISTDLGTSYEYVGAKPPLDVFNLHASVMVNLGQRVAMSANYHAAFNHIERNHSGNVGLRVRF